MEIVTIDDPSGAELDLMPHEDIDYILARRPRINPQGKYFGFENRIEEYILGSRKQNPFSGASRKLSDGGELAHAHGMHAAA